MRPLALGKINEAMLLPENAFMRERIATFAEKQKATDDKFRRETLIAAHQGDESARALVAAAREERINLNIWADNIAMSLFEVIELDDDEWPEIVNYLAPASSFGSLAMSTRRRSSQRIAGISNHAPVGISIRTPHSSLQRYPSCSPNQWL